MQPVTFTAPAVDNWQRQHGDGPVGTVRREGLGHDVRRRVAWTGEQKVEIVLESLRAKEPNVKICRKYHISEPTLYKWRNLFLEGGKAFLTASGTLTVKSLLEDTERLKRMLADLSMVYRRLQAGKTRARKWPAPRAD